MNPPSTSLPPALFREKRSAGLIRTLWVMLLWATSASLSLDAAQDLRPERWEGEIAEFERGDQKSPPPKGAILFVGSSSIRLWTNAAAMFPNRTVLARGFGGSHLADLNHYIDRIVLPYSPSHILVYEGDNDLAAGKSPRQVADDFAVFVARTREKLPRARITYISIKPSKARWALADKIRECNGLIARFAADHRRVGYIDVFNPMLNREGKPREELLGPDGLHMNPKGYELWRDVIRKHL
ncbi:MAG: hypothetical protein HYR88_01410 [Verrucomicrobia bacterium]|nr:hypothetical protein [Verrucomicrobiota bacterium]MBI3867857.1 hypothetical protein [Verrucomicrobiota bacterium]